MKKRILCLLIGSLILLTACKAGQKSEPVLTEPLKQAETFDLARVSDEKLNPLTVTNNTNKQLLSLTYDGLVSVNAAFEAMPLLADFTQNGTDFVFVIKEGANFWDGTAVTPADAEYSYRLASAAGSPYSERFRFITSFKAVGNQFIVSMTSALPSNVNLCDIPIIKAGTETQNFPVGSGRYLMAEENGEIYLQCNKGWIGGAAFGIERIGVRQVVDIETLRHSFNAGSVKAIYTDTLSNSASYKGDIRYIDFDTTSLNFLGVNCTRPYLSDGSVRKAFSMSIRRSKITADTLIKKAEPTWAVFSPVWAEMKKLDIPEDVYLPESASSTFSGAGFSKTPSGYLGYGGADLQLSIIVDSSNEFKKSVAAAVAKDFKNIGFNVTVLELSTADFTAALQAKNFDFFIGEVKFCSNMDITSLCDSSINRGGFDPALINTPINTLLSGGSLLDTVTAIYDQSPIIPLYYKKESLAVTRKLSEGVLPVQESIFNKLQNCTIQN